IIMSNDKIKLASTAVVLLKWGNINGSSLKKLDLLNKKPLEKFDYRVMMVKRSNKIKFFPSAHVFPGGAVDQHDFKPEWSNIFEKGLNGSPIKNLPIKVSALREVLEETNFFLDKNRQLMDEKNLSEIESLQKNLMDREASAKTNFLFDFLNEKKEKDNIVVSLNNLYQWARWVTPDLGPKQTHRFDTYFYLNPLYEYPELCKIDGTENTQLDWFSPDEALEEHRLGNISLPPPTWFTFQQLSKLYTLDEVINVAKQREEAEILYEPKMVEGITIKKFDYYERNQVLNGDSLFETGKEGPSKNRIIIRSRSGSLTDQYSWYYEYLNNIPNSIDRQYNGCKTNLPSKL
ncbi:hypothetical protein DICPUDRAFT_42098, partial [Dictyostelium purpureum]